MELTKLIPYSNKMNSKLHNIIFLFIIAISIFLVIMMKNNYINIGFFSIIPYIFVFLSLWLLLSINMLKNAIKNLYEVPTEKRIDTFGKLLKKTFFLHVFVKKEELVNVYHHVINLKQVRYNTKVKLHEAFESKYIYVPYPSNRVNFRKVKR